jgi:hypothetical protein
MEYVIGPVFAILVSLPFTHFKTVQTEEKIKALQTKIELIETNHSERLEKVEAVVQIIDREVPKKMVGIIQPVAVAVKELQSAIGIQ